MSKGERVVGVMIHETQGEEMYVTETWVAEKWRGRRIAERMI